MVGNSQDYARALAIGILRLTTHQSTDVEVIKKEKRVKAPHVKEKNRRERGRRKNGSTIC